MGVSLLPVSMGKHAGSRPCASRGQPRAGPRRVPGCGHEAATHLALGTLQDAAPARLPMGIALGPWHHGAVQGARAHAAPWMSAAMGRAVPSRDPFQLRRPQAADGAAGASPCQVTEVSAKS